MVRLSDDEISNLESPQFGVSPEVDRSPLALLEVDAMGSIVHVDGALGTLLGVDLDVSILVGATLEECGDLVESPTEDFCRFVELVSSDTMSTESRAHEMASSDGRILGIEFLPLVMDGEISRRIWVVRDDTVRLMELDRIRFHAAVLSQVSDAVLTVDANMAISYWNKGAEELTGRKASDVIGLGPEDVFQFRFASPGDEHTA